MRKVVDIVIHHPDPPSGIKMVFPQGAALLLSLLAPTQAVLKDHFSFRTLHSSVDTGSQFDISLCPLYLLPSFCEY